MRPASFGTAWPAVRRWVVRAAAASAFVVVLLGGVWPSLGQPHVPTSARVLWLAIVAAACVWPRHSLLAWIGLAPLLPIVPSLLGWQEVPLPALWLAALAVAALPRFFARPDPAVLPRAAVLWLLVATASLLVVMFPFYESAPSLGSFLHELRDYAVTDLMSAGSQRPRFSPVLAWFVLAEGILALWLVLFTFRERRPDRARAAGCR